MPVSRLLRDALVVEDSPIIARDIAASLKGLGVETVRIQHDIAGALNAIGERTPDFAVLDTELDGQPSQPIAKALHQRAVRFVIAAGYAQSFEPGAACGAAGWLNKPFGRSEISRWIQI